MKRIYRRENLMVRKEKHCVNHKDVADRRIRVYE